MAGFYNAQGEVQQLDLNVSMYAQAGERGMSLPQFLATTYPTNEQVHGSVFNQILASEGIAVRPDRSFGIRASTMDEILNPKAGTVVKDGVPTSRILFPAVILQTIEDRLNANLTMTADAFESLIAIDESIAGDRYEQAVINASAAGNSRSQGISQLARPASMVSITVSDKAYRIPTFAIGLEISDQAMRGTTMDLVTLAIARQAAVERNERALGYMSALWNGDTDNGESSLSTLGLVDNASSFDAAATGGAITQKAWMKFLMKNGTKRTITHLVTDIDTAMKIEGRTGKPTVMGDDPTSKRIDTQFDLLNPTWAKNPKIFLTQDPSWAANTIMGLDSSWAVRRVRNLNADYNAIEAYVMRRSTEMRIDFGEHVNRLYSDAFAGLVLA